MAVIVNKTTVSEKSFTLEIGGIALGNAGQFYMLRAGEKYPLLARPVSVFDVDETAETVKFYIEIVGEGTAILSQKKNWEKIEAYGPYGNGFPIIGGDAVLIGGACGAAPLHYLAKSLIKANPNRKITAYVGYPRACAELDFFKKSFNPYCKIITAAGGFITDKADFSDGTAYACGPNPMLKAVKEKAAKSNATAYLSLDSRMACGVGACLGCAVSTVGGNKRVCKDGPVFDAAEVIL